MMGSEEDNQQIRFCSAIAFANGLFQTVFFSLDTFCVSLEPI